MNSVEIIADLLNQHCHHVDDDWLATGCLSTNEEAFEILEEMGKVERHPKMDWYRILWDKI